MSSGPDALKLIVGLGNPGPRYARTRHNVGWRLAERLAGEETWRDFEGQGLWCRAGGLILAKPLTFMNESGRFVGMFSRFHKIVPGRILVCFDDVALPLGRLRLRLRGSCGGHRGMESIITALGTQDIPRLRIGVGPQSPGMDSAAFVLSRFSSSEEKDLECALEASVQAVRLTVTQDFETAMNRFNPAP